MQKGFLNKIRYYYPIKNRLSQKKLSFAIFPCPEMSRDISAIHNYPGSKRVNFTIRVIRESSVFIKDCPF
jgi:hypothetical protein